MLLEEKHPVRDETLKPDISSVNPREATIKLQSFGERPRVDLQQL